LRVRIKDILEVEDKNRRIYEEGVRDAWTRDAEPGWREFGVLFRQGFAKIAF